VIEGVEEDEEQLVLVVEDFSPPPALLRCSEPVLLVELTTLRKQMYFSQNNIRFTRKSIYLLQGNMKT
jgi:hypothetical protein